MKVRTVLLAILLITGCGAEHPVSPMTPSSTASSSVDSGQPTYEARCAFCHGPKGEGDTTMGAGRPGANLADGKWLYGSSREEIASTITNGVPGTPMPGFASTLSPSEIDTVTSFVLRMKR